MRSHHPTARRWLRTAAATAMLSALATLPLTTAPTASASDTTAEATAIRGGTLLTHERDYLCRVAFNATTTAGTRVGLMPGACSSLRGYWHDGQHWVGYSAQSRFPEEDYGYIVYHNPELSYPSELASPSGAIPITRAADPTAGQPICHTSPNEEQRCGNVSWYVGVPPPPDDPRRGLFRSDICPEAGDYGGPGFYGDTALGMIVYSTGSCDADGTGGYTYYQPIVPVLEYYGLTVGY